MREYCRSFKKQEVQVYTEFTSIFQMDSVLNFQSLSCFMKYPVSMVNCFLLQSFCTSFIHNKRDTYIYSANCHFKLCVTYLMLQWKFGFCTLATMVWIFSFGMNFILSGGKWYEKGMIFFKKYEFLENFSFILYIWCSKHWTSSKNHIRIFKLKIIWLKYEEWTHINHLK